MATKQQIDDEILARAIAAQIEMVAESEINGWELLRLFQLANAAKRKSRKICNDVFLGYSAALEDIGKIGEASGLNSSLYMTHSPRQVAGMVLQQATKNAARIAELEQSLGAAHELKEMHKRREMEAATRANQAEAKLKAQDVQGE